jgi:hypothetical protein
LLDNAPCYTHLLVVRVPYPAARCAAVVHVMAVLDDASNVSCQFRIIRTPKDFPVPGTAVMNGW